MPKKTYADFTREEQAIIDIAARAAFDNPELSGEELQCGRKTILDVMKEGYFSIYQGKVYLHSGSGEGCGWSRRIVDSIPKDLQVIVAPDEPLPGYQEGERKKPAGKCPVTSRFSGRLARWRAKIVPPENGLKKNLKRSAVISTLVGVASAGVTGAGITGVRYATREIERSRAIHRAATPEEADHVADSFRTDNPVDVGWGTVGTSAYVGGKGTLDTFGFLAAASGASAGIKFWKRRRKKDGGAAPDQETGNEDAPNWAEREEPQFRGTEVGADKAEPQRAPGYPRWC